MDNQQTTPEVNSCQLIDRRTILTQSCALGVGFVVTIYSFPGSASASGCGGESWSERFIGEHAPELFTSAIMVTAGGLLLASVTEVGAAAGVAKIGAVVIGAAALNPVILSGMVLIGIGGYLFYRGYKKFNSTLFDDFTNKIRDF